MVDIDKNLDRLKKIPEILSKTAAAFSKFRPDITNLSINCRDKSAEMALRFTIPDNKFSDLKKIMYDVRLPASSVTSVKMYSRGLFPVENAWLRDSDSFVLDFSKLP